MEAFLSGVVAGYGIAIPVGAVGTYLVALTARTSFRVGGAGALGVASADGLYAVAAALGGAALAPAISGIATPLRWASFAVLVAMAAWIGSVAIADWLRPHRVRNGRGPVHSPLRAYATLLGATLLNPATVVYYAALVLGSRDGTIQTAAGGAAFVLGAFLASASWQLLLAGGGTALGHLLTGPVGRLATGVVSAALVAVLAIWMVLPG